MHRLRRRSQRRRDGLLLKDAFRARGHDRDRPAPGHDEGCGGRLRANAVGRGPSARGAHQDEAARLGVLEAGIELGADGSRGRDGDADPVRLGRLVGVAKRQRDSQSEDRGKHGDREQPAGGGGGRR
jgi:hypothetical protein